MPNEYPNFDEYIAIAEQGDASAQHNLAYLYATGERDTPKDNKKAIFWYTKAAEQGYMFAQFSLGFSYLIGKYDNADIIVNLNLNQDMAKAKYWLEKSKDQGHKLSLECWNAHELWKY